MDTSRLYTNVTIEGKVTLDIPEVCLLWNSRWGIIRKPELTQVVCKRKNNPKGYALQVTVEDPDAAYLISILGLKQKTPEFWS